MYCGALLATLKAQCMYYKNSLHYTTVTQAQPSRPEKAIPGFTVLFPAARFQRHSDILRSKTVLGSKLFRGSCDLTNFKFDKCLCLLLSVKSTSFWLEKCYKYFRKWNWYVLWRFQKISDSFFGTMNFEHE